MPAVGGLTVNAGSSPAAGKNKKEARVYYKLIFDDGIYYSKPVLASYLRVGDEGFQRMVLDGAMVPREVLGRMIYTLRDCREDEMKRIDREFYPKVQLVDEALRTVKECARAGSGDIVLRTRSGAGTWRYMDEDFVRLSDVRSRSLYRDQHKLPTVDVCGTRFIALGRVIRGERLSVALG